MRLSEFIRTNTERVLQDWEHFARSISPDPEMTALELRDNAKNMLEAIADDMESEQTEPRRHRKSLGEAGSSEESEEVDSASEVHARERVNSGFELVEMVSEYRALRASVTRLWFEQEGAGSGQAHDDIRRFHEALDQSMAVAIRRYAQLVDRSRQIFLAILGHDLRNPLSAIAMNASLLNDPDSGVDPTEIGAGIASSAQAMHEIVHDLLCFAGDSLGASIPVNKQHADLRTILDEVVREARAGHPSCSIALEGPTGDLHGLWDPTRLRQMLCNLIGNAIQHGDGSVDVHARPDGDGVLLTVRNGGEPIPPAKLPTIFNPLIRAEQPGRPRRGSLGLGLYIAREVAKAHGGTIKVRSTSETGTAFTVRMPRHHEADSAGVSVPTAVAKNTG